MQPEPKRYNPDTMPVVNPIREKARVLSMYQRKGKWYSDFWWHGKRYVKSWGDISKTEATRKDRKHRTEVMEGNQALKAKRITFEKFSEKYIEYVQLNKRASTAKRYQSSLNNLKPHFKGKLIESIMPFAVQRFKKARRDEGKERATVNRDVATLRNMLNKAVEWGYLSSNPMATVKQFQEDNEVMWVLSAEEEKALLEEAGKLTAKSKYMVPMIKVALHTGMRQAEIFNIKKRDAHLEERYIFIPETKTHLSRKVPINDTLLQVLSEALEDKNNKAEYVFPNCDGKAHRDIKNGFWKIIEETGLYRIETQEKGKPKKVRFRFHDLRHTFGSRLGMKGVDLKTIMDIMGHKTYKVAMRYQHPTPEHKLDAVRILDEVPSIFTTGDKSKVTPLHVSA